MGLYIQLFISFLMLSCMYTLVAVGFTMYVGVINLANFSHGDTCVIGSFVLMPLLSSLNIIIPYSIAVPLAITVAVGFGGLWGSIIYSIMIRPLLDSPRLIILLATVAAGQGIRELIRVLYPGGSNPQPFPRLFPKGGFYIRGVLLTWENLAILMLTVSILFFIYFFLYKTRMGLAMRCTSQNYEVSQMMGINLNRTVMSVFILGSALAAIAGIMNGAYYQITKFDLGSILGIKGFSAAVIGGLGNPFGAVVGAMIISVVEVFASALIPNGSQFQDFFVFIVVILFLVAKPSGILGEKIYEKV